MKHFLLISSFSLILLASNDAESLYLKNACNSCHGMYAEGMGASPRLQGVREDRYDIEYDSAGDEGS